MSTFVPIPPESAQALAYHAVSNSFWVADALLGIVIPLGLFLLNWGSTRPAGRSFVLFRFALGFFLLNQVIRLPLSYAWSNAHAKAAGQGGTGILEFLGNEAPGLLLQVFGLAFAAVVVYRLMSISKERWWAWSALAVSGLVFIIMLAEPFTLSLKPLGNSDIETKIVALAARVQVPATSIVTEHCEPASLCPPGHVVGLGPTRRLILDDALLQRSTERMLMQMVAHELKHFAKDDNRSGIAVIAVICFVGFGLCHLLAQKILGHAPMNAPASLPLIVLLLTAFYLLILPGLSLFRQHVEREADRYGLELNQDGEALALLMLDDIKSMPLAVIHYTLLFRLTRATHPSIGERIEMANRYQPPTP